MKNLSIILIGLGVWMLLFSSCRNIKRMLTSKEERFAIMQVLIKKGEYPATVNFNEVINEKVKEGYIISTALMGLGLILISGGIMTVTKRTSLNTSIIEVGIHIFYWLIFCFLVGFVMSGFGNHFSTCTIDWIYMFFVAALTGFYAGYLYVYKYYDEKKWGKFFWILMFSAALGSTLSYFHSMVWNGFLYSNLDSIFHFQSLLALGFFAFIAFVHVFIAMLSRDKLFCKVAKAKINSQIRN